MAPKAFSLIERASSGMSRKVVWYIAFPSPIGIQLFPIGVLMQSMTAQFHFRKDVTQNFLDAVNVVVTEHPERKAEIKILIGKDRIAGIVADDMAFEPSIVLFRLKPLSHILKIHDVHHTRWYALKQGSRPRTATRADFQHDRVLRYIGQNAFGKHLPVRSADMPFLMPPSPIWKGRCDVAT